MKNLSIFVVALFIGSFCGFYLSEFKHADKITNLSQKEIQHRQKIGQLRVKNWQLQRACRWAPVIDQILTDTAKLELDCLAEKLKQKRETL